MVKKAILTSGVVLTSIGVLTKLLGFFREIYLVKNTGFSVEYDNYLIMLSVSGLLISGLRSGFVNLYSSYLLSNKLSELEIYNVSSLIIFFAGVVYVPIFFLVLPFVYSLNLSDIYSVFPLFILYILLTLKSSLYIAQLVSQKKFVTSEFATLINPVLPIIIYIGSTFLEVKLNLFILVSVLLIGAVSEYSYLYYKTKRILFKLNFSLNFSEIKYLKEILFLFFSSIILSLMTLVDVYFASNLSSGDVSLLLTSSKFIAFGIGVLSSSVGIMIIPYLAEAYLISINYFIKFINKVLIYTFLTCIIILTFAYFLIPEIIPLLFKSETISSLDIDYLVSYILVGLPIIPLSLIGLILSRGMISLGISKKMIAINIIALAINIVSDYFLVKEYSVVGLILSTSVVYLWTSLSMYWAIRLKTKKIKDN